MKKFMMRPEIEICENTADFLSGFEFNSKDLVFMSSSTMKYFKDSLNGANVLLRGDYGKGEPTDKMVEAIHENIEKNKISYDRVIAIGGGTIVDVAKLLALKTFSPVEKLFDKEIKAEKEKELIIIPTTCGTGSEVTNISILEFIQRKTKFGLADESLFADKAVLIPELLEGLPFSFFATSSIDALIHAVESYLSPKANEFTKVFSEKAIKMILSGYSYIAKNSPDSRKDVLKDFLIASTYAGIAFGNAGTGAVHAMSYPFSGEKHVAHGEANYVLFTEVLKMYENKNPKGKFADLLEIFSSVFGCKNEEALLCLEKLLQKILPLNKMSFYGVEESSLESYCENVLTKQTRLTANNYVPLSKEDYLLIYKNVL